MIKFTQKLIIVLLVFFAFQKTASQDNYHYSTPIMGNRLYFKQVTDANRNVIKMSESTPISEGNDGLMLSFMLRCNLDQINEPLKLVSFTTSTEENSFMDVFYDDGTLTFRRKLTPGSPSFYDYNLFDPMFQQTGQELTWEIRIFFTSYFFWIEIRDTRILVGRKYHAPVFFGINLPNDDFMGKYLSNSSQARFILGDSNEEFPFSMPSEVSIYEFKYKELKDELQNHFCEEAPVLIPSPPVLANKMSTQQPIKKTMAIEEEPSEKDKSTSANKKEADKEGLKNFIKGFIDPNNKINIEIKNELRYSYSLYLYDLSNKLHFQKKFSNHYNIHYSKYLNLPTGIYVMLIEGRNTRYIKKILIKN